MNKDDDKKELPTQNGCGPDCQCANRGPHAPYLVDTSFLTLNSSLSTLDSQLSALEDRLATLDSQLSGIPSASNEMLLNEEHSERERIEKALRAANGNKSEAARILGIDRKTLYNRLKKYL